MLGFQGHWASLSEYNLKKTPLWERDFEQSKFSIDGPYYEVLPAPLTGRVKETLRGSGLNESPILRWAFIVLLPSREIRWWAS